MIFPHTGGGLGSAAQVNTGLSEGDVVVLLAGGVLPASTLPSLTVNDTFLVSDQTQMLALSAAQGDVAIRSDEGKTYILSATPASTLGNWLELLSPTGGVLSVAGLSGTVVGSTLKTTLALDLVDNTSDADKPVSVAQGAAIASATAQATEGVRGTLKVAPTSEVTNDTTTDDTDAVTPLKWWQGFAAALSTPGFWAGVRNSILSGFSASVNDVVVGTDSLLDAIGKLQAQITARDSMDVNDQTGTSYTLQVSDAGPNKYLRFDSAPPVVLIIPANATSPLPLRKQINCITVGAGQVTIAPAAGVNVTSLNSALKTLGKGASFSLVQTSLNNWDVIGALTT